MPLKYSIFTILKRPPVPMKNPVELMLPVGTREMFYAAVHNGADAVYFGVPHWNARGRTEDFSFDDVREMIRYARLRGVRTFLAMNILIFEREIEKLPEFLEAVIQLEPDAFIIQDVGLARMVKSIAPAQEIHASTQMTIASAEALRMAEKLGFQRCVLARELSLSQIQSIRSETSLELEVFVHGALCVSYSGQCLTSENFGGRSANRGQCAQSCRLPYHLFVDGIEKDLHGKTYLFSPRDLCAIPTLDKLREIGVSAFKVEGRLKSPEYVAAVASAYRSQIDTGHISPAEQDALETLFSRGLYTGWLEGVNHQALVEGSFSNHHGQYLGTVVDIDRHYILVKSKLKPLLGDGILFEPAEKGNSAGARLYGVEQSPEGLILQFGMDFDTRKVEPGMKVFRNDSPTLEKELRKTFTGRESEKHIPIRIVLEGAPGTKLRLTLNDSAGHQVTVESEEPLEAAKTERDPGERCTKELSGLAATAYQSENIDVRVSHTAFVQDKLLRTLRQEAVLALDNARLQWNVMDISAARGKALLEKARTKATAQKNADNKPTEITVLVRRPEQIEALEGQAIQNVIMDFDWGVDSGKPMARIRELGFKAGMATLRIHKPGENHYLRRLLELRPDFALVRNLGSLAVLAEKGIPLVGDYSLNTTNSLSAEWFLEQGLETLHPSLDLNSEQLMELLHAAGGEPFEIAIHQYMPAFHMEHCIFAAALTQATGFPECGKICCEHKVEILDHKGARHFLESDAECRNTLFVGKPQSALKLLPQLKAAGVRKYRLEMLDDTPEVVRTKVRLYAEAIHGELDLDAAIRLVGVQEKYGVSEGQLFNGETWQDRKKG